MKALKDHAWTWALIAVFLLVPVALITTEPVDVAVGNPFKTALVFAAALTGLPGFVLFVLALAKRFIPGNRRVRVRDLEQQQKLGAWGSGFLVATVTLSLATTYAPIAGIYASLALAYALWCVPSSTRLLQYRLTVVVRCTPAAAFALVSDPRNWNRYLPQLDVKGPVDVPVHLGSIIHFTWTEGRLIVDQEEQVIALEPGHRFGTASLHRRPSDGVYEFKAVAGGTEIAFMYVGAMTVSQAVLGGAFRRLRLLKRLTASRELGMQRIKQLLEAPEPVTV